MHHSITFGDKNTWEDWHLVPTSRPVINPPKPKTQYVDIPGADGSIDLTESLAGRPVFSDREGSIEFVVLNDFNIDNYDYNWIDVYTEVLQYLHGRRMRMILEDDPDHYYYGRFAVNSWKSDANNSTITIDYVLNPYKYFVDSPFAASDLDRGGFLPSGNAGQNGYMIYEAVTDAIARLRSPKRYAPGDTIRVVDNRFQFGLALYNSGTGTEVFAKYPTAKNFIEASSIVDNEYQFTDSGYYRFQIHYPSGPLGPALTDDDLEAMAAAIRYYTGGIL